MNNYLEQNEKMFHLRSMRRTFSAPIKPDKAQISEIVNEVAVSVSVPSPKAKNPQFNPDNLEGFDSPRTRRRRASVSRATPNPFAFSSWESQLSDISSTRGCIQNPLFQGKPAQFTLYIHRLSHVEVQNVIKEKCPFLELLPAPTPADIDHFETVASEIMNRSLDDIKHLRECKLPNCPRRCEQVRTALVLHAVWFETYLRKLRVKDLFEIQSLLSDVLVRLTHNLVSETEALPFALAHRAALPPLQLASVNPVVEDLKKKRSNSGKIFEDFHGGQNALDIADVGTGNPFISPLTAASSSSPQKNIICGSPPSGKSVTATAVPVVDSPPSPENMHIHQPTPSFHSASSFLSNSHPSPSPPLPSLNTLSTSPNHCYSSGSSNTPPPHTPSSPQMLSDHAPFRSQDCQTFKENNNNDLRYSSPSKSSNSSPPGSRSRTPSPSSLNSTARHSASAGTSSPLKSQSPLEPIEEH
eukprot:GCRY01002828.1.p1 GENE.GCRY01002828.1~~GCRY01002828.1.p1  ORF type:complete len:470 (+),score=54.29 GCRY01002828.1:265-1674(+)